MKKSVINLTQSRPQTRSRGRSDNRKKNRRNFCFAPVTEEKEQRRGDSCG